MQSPRSGARSENDGGRGLQAPPTIVFQGIRCYTG